MTESPSIVLSASISEAVMKALRAGAQLENVIGTLLNQVEVLQIARPVVNAIQESARSQT